MFKEFAVNKRALSKIVYQILSIVIKIILLHNPHVTFPAIFLHFSLNTSHHLHLKYINYYCDTVIFVVFP